MKYFLGLLTFVLSWGILFEYDAGIAGLVLAVAFLYAVNDACN